MTLVYYDPADYLRDKPTPMPPVLRTRAMPIRFMRAKTAAYLASHATKIRRRIERINTKKVVMARLRDELLKVGTLINTAAFNEKWDVEYDPPPDMKVAEVALLFAIIEGRLKKNGYEVATNRQWQKMTISWG